MRSLVAVVAPAWCTTNVEKRCGKHCFDELPDTLLGFETTGPCPFRGVAFRWGCRRVVAPLWWWGVVFDLWIVVASI